MGAVLVLGATVQPWYLLWAAIPLASAAGNTRFRMAATIISAAFAVALPPTGTTFDFRTYQLPYAYAGAAVVVAIALFVVRKHVPARPRRATAPTAAEPAKIPG
jgi:alpha-1,6-mannosyltransferase